MKYKDIINTVPFRELLNEFISLYLKEYGEIELKKITRKIHSSNTVDKFLEETNIVKIKPLRDDFLKLTHSIYYFTFAKAEKIALASITILCSWQKNVAIPNNIEDNAHLNETFFDIIDKCNGFKFTTTDNFFTKFGKIIDDKYSEFSSVKNELQNVLEDKELMSILVIKKAYDDSRKYFIERMYFPFYEFDYLDRSEINKINKQVFEISIFVLAIISKIVWSKGNTTNITNYAKFLGRKMNELSTDEDYSDIFYVSWDKLLPKIVNRISFYEKDIEKLVEDKIYNPPHCIFYYFYLNPGNYIDSVKFTCFEEEEIMYLLKNENLPISDLVITSTINDIYDNISRQLS